MKNNHQKSIIFEMRHLTLNIREDIGKVEWINHQGTSQLAISHRVSPFYAIINVYSTYNESLTAVKSFDLPAGFSSNAWNIIDEGVALFSIVSVRPGSAMCPLVLWNESTNQDVQLNTEFPMGVYKRPRFVKRSWSSKQQVVAIERSNTSESVVLFAKMHSEASWERRVLYELEEVGAGKRLQQVVAVQTSNDEYFLFIGVATSQAEYGPQTVVFCIKYDKDFAAFDHILQPLGNNLFHDFDVDVVEGRVIIFGTNAEGVSLTEGRIEDDRFVKTARLDEYFSVPISSPSIFIYENNVFIAAVKNESSTQTRVLWARHEVQIPKQ